MRVGLESTVCYEVDKLLGRYPCLNEYHFMVVDEERCVCTIDISSLDDILNLINKTGKSIIIIKDDEIYEDYRDYPYLLEIYDGYRE